MIFSPNTFRGAPFAQPRDARLSRRRHVRRGARLPQEVVAGLPGDHRGARQGGGRRPSIGIVDADRLGGARRLGDHPHRLDARPRRRLRRRAPPAHSRCRDPEDARRDPRPPDRAPMRSSSCSSALATAVFGVDRRRGAPPGSCSTRVMDIRFRLPRRAGARRRRSPPSLVTLGVRACRHLARSRPESRADPAESVDAARRP